MGLSHRQAHSASECLDHASHAGMQRLGAAEAGRVSSTQQAQRNQSDVSQASLEDAASAISWMRAPELPGKDKIITLVEEYFAHVHPLRCFGFVHKPSFMQRLDEDFDTCCNNESLLHVICALGAKFLALDYSSRQVLAPEAVLEAGNQWARKAKGRIFADLDDLSLEKLMTAILLYDHDLRIGSYASAFMLSGITSRMSQALQLNLEHSADVLCLKAESSSSAVVNETRRRLMWSCYVMDSWVGSGVNQLTLLEDRDLKIQLPCDGHNFSLGIPCITELLDEGKVLGFVPSNHIPPHPAQNMGIEAYFIRLVSLRKKVLRYVKHLDIARPPWLAGSEFLLLSAEFDNWRYSLPQSLQWRPDAIYARRESSQLGALTLLWCTYYQTLVDLYRIGMPAIFRLRKNVEFPPDQQGFLKHCRSVCYENAREVSNVISEALRHGIKALADTWLCIIAHDSTKVMLYYMQQNEMAQGDVGDIKALVQRNLDGLIQMRPMVATAEYCCLSMVKMMIAAGIQPHISQGAANNGSTSEPVDEMPSIPGSPVQESPENVLNPLAIYRMARTALHERDSGISTSLSPSTHSELSTAVLQPRSLPQRDSTNFATSGHPQSHQDHSGQGLFQQTPLHIITGSGGAWDPADMAVMDMLNGGITPWTAEYLTDGQSNGVDPFLFPF
ncbi:hypothetical protein N7474_007475 [Penicillium riverlandense]|uniref:uncharacterized protein n=1 Tax=Penicillium riverlandense TaxID=1903569 RepID=UPI0025478838|nr:uncharacterized protein N7474_007475 [Penicillium riverlandense]KAJ5815698.1 hypothetical protein N7474_007475 [Penicillium riverlandense]